MPASAANPLQNDALGIYISIPFCRSKCTYCNFASGVYPASQHAVYVDRLLADLSRARNSAAEAGAQLPRRVDSIYLGGGTPTLLAPTLLARIFAALGQHFDLAPAAEITVECAPGQLSDATLEALAQAGVNRVSLGVQSFVDAEAHAVGRLHTRSQILADLDRLRAVGIVNLNLDLMAGLPGQTAASWAESLAELVQTQAPHASVYMLEIDEDSRLGHELLSGGSRYRATQVPDEEVIVEMYETACSTLAAAGLSQYEISNFARPGAESRHNLRYWQRRSYLGLGLDAASMLRADPEGPHAGQVMRTSATSDLTAYLAAAPPVESEWLSPARQHEEAWFLGLRTNQGVAPAELRKEFGAAQLAPALKAAETLLAEGLLEQAQENLRLTPRGRLLSNEVFERFLDLEPVSARLPQKNPQRQNQ
jgi:oxygen-independent coproporphyrinogen-3 oxidase